MEKATWFSTWFDSPYYHQLYASRDDQEAKHFIEKAIEVEEGKPYESTFTTNRIYASVWDYADSFRVDDKMDETTKACCKLGCSSPPL